MVALPRASLGRTGNLRRSDNMRRPEKGRSEKRLLVAVVAIALVAVAIGGAYGMMKQKTPSVPGRIAFASPSPVNLGTAGNYVILAQSGISATGLATGAIVGNIAVSPIDSTAITGFGLVMDASGQFSTSSLVVGNVYAADYAAPTPATLTTAVSDMQTAFTNAAGRTPDSTELGSGDISGMNLAPGVYKWSTGVTITSGVTLTAVSASDVWIFQIAQDLTVANGAIVTLAGGALPGNIFWQVSGAATLGTTCDFKGVILCQTNIAVQTGATVWGNLLAQTAVTLQSNTVTEPTQTPIPEFGILIPVMGILGIIVVVVARKKREAT